MSDDGIDFTPLSSATYVKPNDGIDFQPLQSGTGDQKSGFIPTKEDLISMLPKPQEIPAMVGSLAGQATRKTIPGAALAALGSAGMEGYSQVAQRAGIMPGQAPQTSGEALKRMGKAALTAGLSELAMRQIVNPALGFVGRQIFPGAEPATQAAVQAATSEGINPLPSSITKSKAIAGMERAAEFSPFGSTISKAREKSVEDFGNFAKRVGESISPDKPAELNGTLVKESAKGYYENFNDMKNKLYDSFMPVVKDSPVDIKPIISNLESTIATAKNRGEGATASYAQGILDKITNLSELPTTKSTPGMASMPPQLPSFAKVKDIATGVGTRTKFFDPTNPGMQGSLKGIYGAFQDALDNTAEKYGGEDVAKSLSQAKDYFSTGKGVLGSKVYKALIAAPQGSEFKIAFNSNDPLAYDTVKEVVGDDLMGNLSRQWYDGIMEKSTKNGITSPQLLLNNLDKSKKLLPKIAEDFPEASAQIEKLKQVATLLTKNSDVMRGSQTAPLATLYGTMAEIGGSISQLFAHPLAAAGGVALGAGALGAAKAGTSFAVSDTARNLLTQGYPAIQTGVERAAGSVITPAMQLKLSRKLNKGTDANPNIQR